MSKDKWRFSVFVLLALTLPLSACNFGHQPTPAPKIEAAIEDPHSSDLPVDSIARRDAAILAERPDFIGRIVYVRENSLYKLLSDVVEPELLATGIDPNAVYQSPDNRQILFATTDYVERAVYRVDWRNSDHTKLIDLRNSDWRPMNWSPDGEWVALLIGVRDLVLTNMNGSLHYVVGSAETDVFWLSDGNVLTVDHINETSSNGISLLRFTAAAIVDTETGVATPLEIDLAQLSSDWSLMIVTLQRLGVTISDVPWQIIPSTRYVSLPANTMAEQSGMSPYCRPWQISSFVNQNVGLFKVEDVFRLTDLRDMPDGSLLYLEWRMPSCTITTPKVVLKRLQFERDGTATIETVLDDLFSGIGIGQINNTGQQDSALYAILPDGKTMLWVGGDYTEYVTTLNLFDFETGENHVLIHDVFGALRQTSLPFITAVFWVAS